MAFRFVHCADVHLDSPLRSLALRNSELADLIGAASRRAFSRVIDICLDERVDALFVAGDLYDGDQTSMKTAMYLGNELKRLDSAGIRAFIIRGNHDSLSRITKELTFPDTTKVFEAKAEVAVLEAAAATIAVHGLSFAKAHAPESLLSRYRAPIDGAINIGLMHTSLGGSPGHDLYAPCSAADLKASGFRYWALGHIHARDLSEGACTILMPGMLQGRDVGESGPKSATVVTVADDGTFSCEERITSIAQFERVVVDVAAARDWRETVAAVASALTRARQAAPCDHLVARLVLSGTSPLAWRLRRDADLLLAEAEARALALGATWIDKIEVASVPPLQVPSVGGPFEELRRSITEEVRGSNVTTSAIKQAIEDLRRHLPPECRAILGDGEEALDALACRLAAIGGDEVLARLMPTEKDAA